jgi:hypothetical protein
MSQEIKWYQAVKDLQFGELPDGQSITDPTTYALKTVDYSHYEVHVGRSYAIYATFDLPASNYIDIQIVVPDSARWAHFEPYISSEGGAQAWFYEDVVINEAGTGMGPKNKNRNSANTSEFTFASIVNTSLSNANADTDITGATLLATGKAGAGRGIGGEFGVRNEWVLKQNAKYSVRVLSLVNNATQYVNFFLAWYEHTNK